MRIVCGAALVALAACGSGGLAAPTLDAGAADAGLLLPIAVPIAPATGEVFQEIRLDGSGSYARGGFLIGFAWVLIARPDGSQVQIRDSLAATAYFTPDRAGKYRI